MKAALYARVSIVDQEPRELIQELRRYVEIRAAADTDRDECAGKDGEIDCVGAKIPADTQGDGDDD